MNETLLDRLSSVLASAFAYDSNVVEAPIAVLWTDEERQWESAIPALQQRRRIVSFGAFDTTKQQGPAYWLRCVVAGTIELDGAPDGAPVLYLPGISRDMMRALDAAPPELAALGALQHRCQWFGQPNGKDWTVRSLLSNKDRGLGLNVASDPATAATLVSCLDPLLDLPFARLQSRHIDSAYLNSVLNPDPVRSLLNWIDDPAGMRTQKADGAWAAFVAQCKHDFGFDPAADGEIEGARRLGAAEGHWADVWARFRESPTDYPNIPVRLREAEGNEMLPRNPGAWPVHASLEEERLRAALEAVGGHSQQQARETVLELEEAHKPRRGYVWAELGHTPMVMALEHLAEVARVTATASPGTSVAAIAEWYASTGWHADRAVLSALNEVERKPDQAAVNSAIGAMYRPWLDHTAKALQAAVGPMANSGTYQATPAPKVGPGDVVVFVDGLRLDVAHLLADRLAGAGLSAALDTGLAALPTVTQTAKPVLVPIDQNLLSAGVELDARRAPDGPTADVKVLRSLMAGAEIQVLLADNLGDPDGVAWTEAGKVDHLGHEHGVAMVHELDREVERIATRIEDLLDAGWATVTVVTDHGWLLLPGGLPKCHDLPVAVTLARKGRCARAKDGAAVSVPTVAWHWDNEIRIAVAPGISCFEENKDYEHGGVSPQECVVPRLRVTRGEHVAAGATITSLKWRGLALSVEFTDLPEGARIDLRSAPGDPKSSIAARARFTSGQGRELLMVENEDLEGQRAHLVVVDADGTLLLQRETTVGLNR